MSAKTKSGHATIKIGDTITMAISAIVGEIGTDGSGPNATLASSTISPVAP